MKIFASLIIAVAGLLVLASAAQAGVIGTFDGSGYGTFASMQADYATFIGNTKDTITFEEFFPNGLVGPIGDYYLASKGVRFTNEGSTALVLRDGGQVIGGWYQEDVTGYDGSYQPDGTMLYDKVYNNDPASALTILLFTTPVSKVGSFIADSYYWNSHTHTVRIYDSANNLLTTVNAAINSWGDAGGNAEGFWGVKCDTAEIAKVTFQSPVENYAVTTLDNIAFPEPATMAFLAVGGIATLLRRRRR